MERRGKAQVPPPDYMSLKPSWPTAIRALSAVHATLFYYRPFQFSNVTISSKHVHEVILDIDITNDFFKVLYLAMYCGLYLSTIELL